jgi:predicted ester cyclase
MTRKVKKAKEITDARISFVSLVDKAANKRQFLIVKDEEGKAAFTTYGKIIKTDSESHFVTGVVYEPMVEDAHGNYMTADEIAKAAYWFAKNGNRVDLQHNFVSADGTAVVESWIAKSDSNIGGADIKEGTWLMTVEITDDDLWQSIEKGEITGLSMGGLGVFSKEDTELSEASVKKSKGRVTKGAVADSYKQANISSSFWNAFDALRNGLYSYNGYTGVYTYQTDESKIKEALEDFNGIITELLTDASQSLTKSLFDCKPTPEAGRIEKSGRTLSAKNRAALQNLYDDLGTFLADADAEKDKPGGETGTEEDKQHDGEQISDAAALLYELHPAGDGCGRPRLSGRREGGIGEIDEHRQRKDHQPDPGERYLQIHRTTPAFTANSGSFAGLPWMAISARNSRRKASRSSDSVRCRWSVFARIASP